MRLLLQLRKPYLNILFKSDRQTYTRVIETPGLWMSPAEVTQISNDLKNVVSKLGIGDLDYGVIGGKKEAMDRAVLTIIYDAKTNQAFAFNALSVMNCTLRGKIHRVIHLGLVVVDPHYRAKGLSWILYGFTTFLLFLKNRFKPIWISNVTQVPAIIGMVSESFGNVFPNPRTQSRRTYDHLVLAREILQKHRSVFGVGDEAEFNEEQFVIKNAYTGGSDNLKKTFEQAPHHRNVIYNNFCKDQLNYSRGDDFLQLGQIDLKTYYNYMAHMLPSGSKLMVFYQVLFSVFELSFVPIVQWFSVHKQLGVLRPRGKKI
jgi:hypothetical protein